jgi:hypothetical protein
MKTLRLLITVAALAVAPGAHADKIDLTSLKCSQFVQTTSESALTITAWLVGYYTEVTDTEIVDLTGVKETRSRLSTFCEANPNFDLSSAAEGLLGK